MHYHPCTTHAASNTQVPWLMRAVHGRSAIRMLAIVREPSHRLHSAYYFWPQYRRHVSESAVSK